MKIAFIGGRTFHHADGIATFMYHLATELVKKGHEPIVFCEDNKNFEETLNGFKVIHRRSMKSAFLTKPLLGLRATLHCLFKEKSIQVFHYNTWAPAMIASHIPLLFGRKVVIQGHGLEWKRTKYSVRKQALIKKIEAWSARTNKNWTMVSQEQTDYFAEHYNRKCTTITCAVKMPDKVLQSDFLQRFGLKGNDYFLYMGRLVQDKNPDYLIKGFLQAALSDKKLVLCGGADDNNKYEAYLKRIAGDNDNVIFTGSIFGADKDMAFRNCYAFCIPSTLEGLPMSLLEAMSYGKIAIASDIPACHEALGVSGIYIPYEDDTAISKALKKLVENETTYEWQKEANKVRAKDIFSWESTTNKYICFINRIISAHQNKFDTI